MFSEGNSVEVIKARILKEVRNDIDVSEGSFINDTISPTAIELANTYKLLDKVINLVFAQTCLKEEGGTEFLERRAYEHGVIRKDGVKATTKVRFTGTNGVVIPKGSLVATKSGLIYYTIESGEIVGGYVDIPVEAKEVGIKYNVPANTITETPVQITGVTSVTNPQPVINGLDVETDEDLLIRLLDKVRLPATSGNKYHYELWAKEVEGVGGVRVVPLWNGNGTVKVIIINSNKEPADENLIEDVYRYIETQRPIGANVTVVSAKGVPIDISVKLIIDRNYSLYNIKSDIEERIINYLRNEVAFKESYVSYAIIGSLIIGVNGVMDYTDLTINGIKDNIVIADDEVAYFNSLNVEV